VHGRLDDIMFGQICPDRREQSLSKLHHGQFLASARLP
jgi:hypothetical protein